MEHTFIIQENSIPLIAKIQRIYLIRTTDAIPLRNLNERCLSGFRTDKLQTSNIPVMSCIETHRKHMSDSRILYYAFVRLKIQLSVLRKKEMLTVLISESNTISRQPRQSRASAV